MVGKTGGAMGFFFSELFEPLYWADFDAATLVIDWMRWLGFAGFLRKDGFCF